MKRKLNCILLIEDNHLTNFINRKIIERVGVTDYVHSVENAQDALNYITSQSGLIEDKKYPELIFLDVNMPAFNGWEFLEECKKLYKEHKRKIPIIILTTSPDPGDKLKALSEKEVIDFIRKPLTKESLYEIIEKHFPDIL